jgi:large repetitive protein
MRCPRILRHAVPGLVGLALLASLAPPAAAATSRTVWDSPSSLLPATGALFGAYAGFENGADSRQERIENFEAMIGRKISLDRVFYTWDEQWPSPDDYWSRDQGHVLVLSWGAGMRDGTTVAWADIAAGLWDSTIDARAADLRAFGAPMYFIFHHEPNGAHMAGTPEEFQDAWRHVHDRFIADGVTNVLYTMVMFDSSYNSGVVNDYYPGDSYVDVMGVDAYNWYDCDERFDPWESLTSIMQKFHDFGVAHSKPMIIAEWGSDEDLADPNHKGAWIAEAQQALKAWPDIKGVSYFHSGPPAPTCNWWVDSTPAALAAYQAMGADPYYNPAPPLVTVTSGPSDPNNDPTPTFGFSSNVPNNTFTCSADGDAPVACTSGYTFGSLVDGSHTATITATDPVTGYSGYTTYTWTIDTAPPVYSFTSMPLPNTNDPIAIFKFSSSETGSTFTCKLDGDAAVACTSPVSYGPLADGLHTFVGTTIDPAGNSSAQGTYSWTVDTVPPVATITSGPAALTNQKPATFTFSSNEQVSTYKCSLDGGTYANCTTPKTYSSVPDGPHTMSVEAQDLADNVGAPAIWSWTVDSVKPTVTIVSSPPNPSRSSTASFVFTTGDTSPVTSTCTLDVGTPAPCGSGVQAGSANDGFTRTLTDSWGTANVGGAWVLTSGANADFDVSGSTGTMNLPTANVARLAYLPQVWGDQDVLVRFSLDKMPTSLRVNAYAVGRYDVTSGSFYSVRAAVVYDGTVRVQATKKPTSGVEVALGTEVNLGAIGAANTWYWIRGHFSTEGQAARIQGKVWKDGTAEPTSWTFSYLDGSSPLLAAGRPGLRASPWATSTPYTVSFDDFLAQTGLTYTNLSEGSHTEVITTTDGAGNASSVAYTWSVDTVAPVATITTNPANPSNSTSPMFKFSSTESGSTFICQLDAGAAAACTSPKTYSGLADGSHTFKVTATDKAGNVSAAATYTWTVDTAPPSATITAGPPSLTNSKTATFTFTSNDPNATFKCSKDGATAYSCTSPKVYTSLSDGPHTFTVTATDQAGNSSAGTTWSWMVDATKPTTTITSYPPNPTSLDTATFTFTSSESNVTFTCQLDANAAATCTSPTTYTGITVAQHTFKVYATDQAGNVGTTVSYTWRRV